MPRIRTIKPEFWTDEAVSECSVSARLLFIGTWNFADDDGNLDKSFIQLKAKIFPIDSIDVRPLLEELLSKKLIVEYSVKGKNYLHIKGFKQHQLINRPSKPQCPHFEDSLITHATLSEDSSRKEGSKGSKVKVTTEINEYFNKFYLAYPKKKSKGDAEKVFKALNVNAELLTKMLTAIETAKQSSKWKDNNGKYIEFPATWLRNRGWEDEDNSSISNVDDDMFKGAI